MTTAINLSKLTKSHISMMLKAGVNELTSIKSSNHLGGWSWSASVTFDPEIKIYKIHHSVNGENNLPRLYRNQDILIDSWNKMIYELDTFKQ